MLAPGPYKKFASYIIAWLTALAWIATVGTESMFAGTIIQGMLIINNPEYEPQQYQGTLLAWLVIFVAVFINVIVPGIMPKIETFILVFHITGFVAIVALLGIFTTLNTGLCLRLESKRGRLVHPRTLLLCRFPGQCRDIRRS